MCYRERAINPSALTQHMSGLNALAKRSGRLKQDATQALQYPGVPTFMDGLM